MPTNAPEGMPRITPYLLYEDAGRAVEWLCDAFGFRETLRYTDGDGKVTHAELRLADGVVMLGHPGPDYKSPKRLGQSTQHVHVYVDDLDAHFRRAQDAGATIVAAPSEQPYGDRRYDADDPEGVRWSFAERLRDVRPEDWGATTP